MPRDIAVNRLDVGLLRPRCAPIRMREGATAMAIDPDSRIAPARAGGRKGCFLVGFIILLVLLGLVSY
jgi:hypothetical protein